MIAMTFKDDETIRAHWRCFVACGLMVLSPFQYGIDFGLIGGMQAMPGFLKVCQPVDNPILSSKYMLTPLR